MINLLPPDTKKDIAFARHNKTLANWLVFLALGFLGTVIIIGLGEIFLHRQINFYNHNVANTQQQLSEQKLTETEAKVKSMSGDIKLALQVLSKQVLFSDLLKRTGAVMPNGSALSSLNISQLQGGIDLNAVAKDYKTASQIQVNLADPSNQIFAKADIQSITCNRTSDPTYPCQVIIRALFAPNNPFSFIKQVKSK